jgi:hypothetical protein
MRYLQFKVEKTTALWDAIRSPPYILELNPACKNLCVNPQVSQGVYNTMYELTGVLFNDFMASNINRIL